MDLEGRTALVTGAARRIGRGIALRLARAGCAIVAHYHRSEAEAQDLVHEIEHAGRRATAITADLADPEAVADLWDRADAALGPVSILVNNAAVYARTPLPDVAIDDWRRALRVNLVAPAELARLAGLAMRARNGGCIVNLLDWAIERPQPGFLPYHAAKGGLEVATRALARELAPSVRVNAVAPGPILPPDGVPTAEIERVLAATPLGRRGTPEDVAAAVEFLCRADYVTGTVLPVDGGRSVG